MIDSFNSFTDGTCFSRLYSSKVYVVKTEFLPIPCRLSHHPSPRSTGRESAEMSEGSGK